MATENKIGNILEFVGLKEKVEKHQNKIDEIISPQHVNLSGGEKQRLLLARALVSPPKLLILDEGLSAIDQASSLELLSKMITFLKKHNCTLVLITHRSEEANLCDKAIVLEKGTVSRVDLKNSFSPTISREKAN